MATTQRRPIGPAKVGAQAPADDITVKTEDVPVQTNPQTADGDPPAPETTPVDTESADYKAGYDAGYSKGFDDGKASVTTPPAPAETETVAAKAATAAELLAAFPDDKGFCMDCLAEGLTMAGANAKAVAALREQLKSEKVARGKAERELAEETGTPAPIRTVKGAASTTDTQTEPSDDPKTDAAAEWDADPAIRKGWSNKANFVAYRSAELAGRHRTMRVPLPAQQPA